MLILPIFTRCDKVSIALMVTYWLLSVAGTLHMHMVTNGKVQRESTNLSSFVFACLV
jgi:hypothetical protein